MPNSNDPPPAIISSPPSVLVSCVGENQPGMWSNRLVNVALSLRHFGGPLRDAALVVNVVESVDDSLRRTLEGLDASVRIVEAVDPVYRFTNKLRMFGLVDDHDADLILMLDCDTVFVGDITPHLRADRFSARMGRADGFTIDQWSDLFDIFGIEPPRERYPTVERAELNMPYFNSGVMVVPRDICPALVERWTHYLFALLELRESHPELVPWPGVIEQRALTFALVDAGIPFERLPAAANWDWEWTRQQLPPGPDGAPHGLPSVLHYHRMLDEDGFIFRPPDEEVSAQADAFNRVRAETLGVNYRGLVPAPPPATKRLRDRLKSRSRAWRDRFR